MKSLPFQKNGQPNSQPAAQYGSSLGYFKTRGQRAEPRGWGLWAQPQPHLPRTCGTCFSSP